MPTSDAQLTWRSFFSGAVLPQGSPPIYSPSPRQLDRKNLAYATKVDRSWTRSLMRAFFLRPFFFDGNVGRAPREMPVSSMRSFFLLAGCSLPFAWRWADPPIRTYVRPAMRGNVSFSTYVTNWVPRAVSSYGFESSNAVSKVVFLIPV